MHPDVAHAVRDKGILLFEEMLRATNFPDMGVVDELRFGSDLTGEVPLTNMLPGKFEPALISEQELQMSAERVKMAAVNEVRSSGDSELDEIVWQKTLDEVAKGWLTGPLRDDQVPMDRPLSRRFGLRQRHDKVRLIDDYSESGVNACVSVSESPSLHTVDVACASLMVWFSLCKEAKIDNDLVVRTLHLASAYRQVGLSERGQKFAFLRVYTPRTKKACFFKCLVLPFGAVRSVHSFLRLARALWWLGDTGCWVVCTSFYDDFIAFSRPRLAGSTEQAVAALFKLLGWIFAEEGDKAHPFDLQCSALGVLLDLSVASTGRALVCNTKTRCAELCDDLCKVVEGGSLTSKNAQRLRGRMQFAEAQLFGRTGRRCLRVLTDFPEGRRSNLTNKDKFFLLMFRDMLLENVPREVTAPSDGNMVVFTDACYEKDHPTWSCGLGGVALAEGKTFFFSLKIVETLRLALGEGEKKQIIFEVETLAALLATSVWKSLFLAASVWCDPFCWQGGYKFFSSQRCLRQCMRGCDGWSLCKVRKSTSCNDLDCENSLEKQYSRPTIEGLDRYSFVHNAIDVSELAGKHLQELVMQIWKVVEKAAWQLPVAKQSSCLHCWMWFRKFTMMKVFQRINTCDMSLSFLKMNLKRLFRKLSVRVVGGRVALAFVLQQNPPSTPSTTWSSTTIC